MKRSLLSSPLTEPVFEEAPRAVSLEITGRCNLRCRHCFNESSPENTSELPTERIESLLDEVASWGVRFLRLSGGEPTAHRQFHEIVEMCRVRGIGIGLNTNGIYSKDTLAYLATAPISTFFVSIDGLEANNDAIRGRGTFRRAVQSIEALSDSEQKVIISFHVGEGNRRDIVGLVALAAKLGVDIKVAPLRPVGRAMRELPRTLIKPRNYLSVVTELTRLRREYRTIRIYTDFDLLDGPELSACMRDPNKGSCKAGRSMLNVQPDGSVNPCAFFDAWGDEFVAGNVHLESATAIWRRPTTFIELRTHQKSGSCQTCGFYQIRCAGGCPAISLSTTGKLDVLDPTCFAHLIEARKPEQIPEHVEPLAFAELVSPPEGVGL